MHPTLTRLDRFAHSVAGAPGVVAVLGLGSAGLEHGRFDDHSDIDFFLVVDDGATKQAYLDDLDWLAGFGGTVTYSFANDPNGRKALLDDGLFLEYAVFTPAQLATLTLAGVRVVWHRAGVDPAALVAPAAIVTTSGHDTVEFHLNEALTNLFVGLHRHLRGERLTAMRFIQVYAVDRVLALVRLTSATPGRPTGSVRPHPSGRAIRPSPGAAPRRHGWRPRPQRRVRRRDPALADHRPPPRPGHRGGGRAPARRVRAGLLVGHGGQWQS